MQQEMEMRRWNEADFDLYLSGGMDTDTRNAFEASLSDDPKLLDQFSKHRHIIQLLKEGYERKALKARLRRLHAATFRDGSFRTLNPYRNIVRFTGNLAAAASVAALVTFALFYFTGKMGMNHKDAYTDLRNEVLDIYSTQESIKKELKRSRQMPVMYTGTSFAVSSDGLLVTNYHVIRDVDSVWVTNFTDTLVRYMATIVYHNSAQDIALLRITDPQFTGFGRLPYSRSSKQGEMGEYVFTLGYSKQDVVFGEGSISSVSGYNSDTSAYQVSIPVNPGNSGGPLFDAHGNLIGIISGKNVQKDGVGFAIKSDYIFDAVAEVARENPENPPLVQMKNRIAGKKRTDQLKILQPLVFKVQIAR